MKFIDTVAEYDFFRKEINSVINKTIKTGRYLLGENTASLEDNFKLITNTENNIAVKNCTDAISIVLKKVYKKNMPVILPNFGAYPTSVAVHSITNNVHYVDVDNTFTIDINKLPNIKNGIIIPVHLFGNNCNMKAIMEYAKTNNHIVIEDCAQSTGSGSGINGDYSVFSFYPTKPLASMADGGMITTRREDKEFFKKFRFYGQLGRSMEFVGVNSRIDEFQAGIVNEKLKKFRILNQKRQKIAKKYKEHIQGIKTNGHCIYHQFPILFKDRDKIIKILKKRKIPHIIHYENHVTDFSFLNNNNYKTTNRINDKIISIPIHPFLKETEIEIICKFLKDVEIYEIKK